MKLNSNIMSFSLVVIILICLSSCNSKTNLDYTSLKAELESIHDNDQKYRDIMGEMAEIHGWKSKEVDSVGVLLKKQDSINTDKISMILEKHGWLSEAQVGEKANEAIFLVIQHSNFTTQEKYLPIMRAAVKDGNARGKDLAYLEDKVALKKGEKQIYGTQIGNDWKNNKPYVRPLVDPINVDKRRKEVGLKSIEMYLTAWNLKWKPEEYINNLEYYINLEN